MGEHKIASDRVEGNQNLPNEKWASVVTTLAPFNTIDRQLNLVLKYQMKTSSYTNISYTIPLNTYF